MNKQQFLNKLASMITALSMSERSKAIEFYAEIIDDRVEGGENETEVIDSLGNIGDLAQRILAENPPRKSTAARVWIIIGLVLGSPLWLSLGLAAAAVLFALFLVAWALIVTFFAVVFSLFVAFVAGFFTSFFFLFNNPLAAFFQIGASLFCGGLGIFALWGTVALTKLCARLTTTVCKKISKLWNRKVLRRHV